MYSNMYSDQVGAGAAVLGLSFAQHRVPVMFQNFPAAIL